MTKALLFNIPAQGHINPSLPLVAELLRRGEEIVYVNSAAHRGPVEALGARFIAYPENRELQRLVGESGTSSIPQNALDLVKVGAMLLPFVNDIIQSEQPDYLIHDSLAGWGMMSAQIYKLPTIALISTFAISMKAMPPVSPGAVLGMMLSFAKRFPEYRKVAQGIEQQYRIKAVGLMDAVACTGDLNIVFTSRAMQPAADSFDSSYKFVGPSIGLRPKQDDFPFEQLRDDGSLVYISLGTINNQNMAFYRECFAAFGDYPAQFVLSAGKQTDIASLGEIPDNFIVRNFVPQLEVLERADLFITHGGLNSVHEGLLNCVPLVVVPQQIEQAGVAAQVAKHGAGIVVGGNPPFGRAKGSELRAAVERALGAENARLQQQAKKLGDSLREAGGALRAADKILRFVEERLSDAQ